MSNYVTTGYVVDGYIATNPPTGAPPPTYVFDSTGILAANKIINEVIPVTVSNGINAFLIIPDAAPFFGDSLLIINSSGNALIENIDYYLTHPWYQANNQIGKKVFGSITLLTGYAVGNYKLNYQTIGGYYVDSPNNTIQSGLIASNQQYLTLDWSTAPVAFPPTPHTQNIYGISGMTQIYQAFYDLINAVKSPKSGVHYNDVVGMSDMFAIGNLDPMMQMVTAIYSMQTSLLNTLSTFFPLSLINSDANAVPTNLTGYEIPLFGLFQFRIGRLSFNPGNQPATITYAGDPFPNQCIFVNAQIHFTDPSTPMNNDKVRLGIPGVSNIPLIVDYDPVPNAGNRTIRYIAIGL